MILGTAGHIDHGKTALVRALTGVDTDRLPEEKKRGITIDLGFAPLLLDEVGTIGIVDVPGHEAFVRTMLAGASGIDIALLVVAADEGVMPQTREHLQILSLLGITRGIVAVTKCDLADGDWLALVRDEIQNLLAPTPLRGAEIVEVSALTGHGLSTLRTAITDLALAVTRNSARSDDLFRMPVDRTFTIKGTGTVVTGTVWSGTIARDATVLIQPGGKTSRIRAIQSYDQAVESATPGYRTAIALADSAVGEIPRGSVLITEKSWQPTREMEVEISLGDELDPTPRTRFRLHLGTSETGARLKKLRRESDNMFARVVLDDPLIARGGDRFVLRLPSPARTVGGGVVVDPHPPSRSRKNLGAQVDSSRIEQMLIAAGSAGVEVKAIPVRSGVMPGEVNRELEKLNCVIVASKAYAPAAIKDLEATVHTFIASESANHPLEAGVSLQTVRAGIDAAAEVIDLVLARLENRREIEVADSLVKPFGWVSKLGQREQTLSDAILHEICTQAAEPPSVPELVVRFGPETRAMLRRLERQGELERVSDDRYYGSEVVARMIGTVRSGLSPGRIYSPAELREVLGVSRKYLIPFLEFCDRKGVTERRENGRRVRQGA